MGRALGGPRAAVPLRGGALPSPDPRPHVRLLCGPGRTLHPERRQRGIKAMSGDHNHGAGAMRAGARHQKRLAVAFGLIGTFFVVEAVGGVLTNSLALLSDDGHMLTDAIGLCIDRKSTRLNSSHKC